MGSLDASLPSFAHSLPVAALPTVNYRALLNGDAAEAAKLLSVSVREGFFYLDLQDGGSATTLENVEQLYQFMRAWFNQPAETKLQDLQSNYTDGYKATGFFAGSYDGTRDAYESLKVSHKALHAAAASPTAGVQSHRGLFEAYLAQANTIARQLLASLATAMRLPPAERFETFHQTSEDSNSVLVLLRYPYDPPAQQSKSVGHNKHTDIGSITVLFTDQWGLQVMAADSQQWEFVAPRPGCAIINVGDSLRFLSQKKLRSCLHRVVPVDGQTSDRYTIAYFLRPDNRVSFIDSNGELVTAEHWHDVKYEVFRATHEEQRRDTVLTGGLEPVEAHKFH
ncbi:Gibberellin 20 oxidase 4 [Tolypocladium ophioglossoides CBS 100239]|uniref:Gibberellin 20 oxidase 4 n=1 Tax=Tolypocladium ophioglossoides (strain CBS 100239) TaxID=1163406 RepID=A0A0L0NFA2_TOLOC|nr:Gibberellin 20 oxidase 4 [Tolypocladium ophioglossoides CBS 100239]